MKGLDIMSRKPQTSSGNRASVLRRRKRLTKRVYPDQASDRQYFAAVRKIARHKIDTWQMEHNPKKFRRRANQLFKQAEKRQAKQKARDDAKVSAGL